MTFQQKLEESIKKNNSLVCIGLDSDIRKIPKHLLSSDTPMFDFNKAIVDATAHLVCCYKVNPAFYESAGAEGIGQLKLTFDYIKGTYPHIPVILDAKRADIGNTNEGYVQYAFGWLKADAVTLHPYVGKEALSPFLAQKDKGLFILCRTSNPGAGEIQDTEVLSIKHVGGDGKLTPRDFEPLYIHVAKKVAQEWNTEGNCMLVVGASSHELGLVRSIVGDMFLLVPGIGAQEGDLEGTLKEGLTKDKSGLIIHSARAIIYADGSEQFADAARKEAEKLRNTINGYRKVVPLSS